MAGSQKEFELLFKLKASLGGNFNSTFKGAIETQRQLQNSIKSVNSMQSKVDGYTRTSNAIEQQRGSWNACKRNTKKFRRRYRRTRRTLNGCGRKSKKQATQRES